MSAYDEWYILQEGTGVPRVIMGKEAAFAALTRGRKLTPRELSAYKRGISSFGIGQLIFIVGEIPYSEKPDRRLWRVEAP